VVSRQVAQHRFGLPRAQHCEADILVFEKALTDGTVITIDVNGPAGHMLPVDYFAEVAARNQAAWRRLAVQKGALLLFASVDCGNPDTLLSHADRIAIDDAGRSGHGTWSLVRDSKADSQQQGHRGSERSMYSLHSMSASKPENRAGKMQFAGGSALCHGAQIAARRLHLPLVELLQRDRDGNRGFLFTHLINRAAACVFGNAGQPANLRASLINSAQVRGLDIP